MSPKIAKHQHRLTAALVALLFWCVSSATMAENKVAVSNMTPTDLLFMQQQRDTINDLAGLHLGRKLHGSRQNDLKVLQLLLDRRIVRNDQTRELQAMGVVMGDLLAKQLRLHWVIYEDQLGRSRALRYKDSDSYLFPITMISRRREVDNRSPVDDIYNKAVATITQVIPALPFQ